MAAVVGMECRLAATVAARMAAVVGMEYRLAGTVAVVLAQLLVVGGVDAKVATKAAVPRAAVGRVGKVACLAVFQEILHCSFLHKVCDTRQMLNVSRYCTDTGNGYACQGN